MPKWSDVVRLGLVIGLALLFAGYGILSYPPRLVTELSLATLGLVGLTALARLVYTRRQGEITARPAAPVTYSALTILLIVLSCVITIQALVARESFGMNSALDAAWGYRLIVWLIHSLFVIVAVWAGRAGAPEVGLGGAILYTSPIYTPTFAVPEAGWPFGPQFALALVLLMTARSARPPRNPAFLPLALFLVWCMVASATSFYPADSLAFLQKLATLVLLAWVLGETGTQRSWCRALALVALTSVGIPTLLIVAKLVQLAHQLGAWPAANYRMAITELGGANLIARTLIAGLPVVVALALSSARKVGWWILTALALVAFVTCHSWGGWVSAVLTALIVLAIWRKEKLARLLSKRRWLASALLVCAALGLLALVWVAAQSNIVSFNGRLVHFRIAVAEIAAHPLHGVGPGHQYLNARYAAGVDWLADNRYTQDHPLSIAQLVPIMSQWHSHNLLLEITAGLGIPGVLLFGWFLISMLRGGLSLVAHASGGQRYLLLGCFAGIVASLGWGLLDVEVVSSPLFASPTWALIGLLWAAPRALATGELKKEEQPLRPSSLPAFGTSPARRPWLQRVVAPAILGMGLVITAILLFSNLHYRLGYRAFQERRWADAVRELGLASGVDPLNTKYREMRAEALLNQGEYAQAEAAYEAALRLKRDFAPYHAQLGWLAWRRGDLKNATLHFEKAVELDPREAWRDGLHADLGLCYAAQGRIEEAISLIQETLKLNPQMALAPYWVPMQAADGRFTVVLDPAYYAAGLGAASPPTAGGLAGEEAAPSPALEQRIVAHLGRADYTPRLFSQVQDAGAADTLLSLSRVLDGIEIEARDAGAAGGQQAARLLATLAEASQLAGLDLRAERTLLEFQGRFPSSAFGFRSLGSLYRLQGRLDEASEMHVRAVQVSPRDVDSWLALAETYLDGAKWTEAERVLDAAFRLAPLDVRLYELRLRLTEGQGDLARQADALDSLRILRESVAGYLAQADLYRQSGRPEQAAAQCTQAIRLLARRNPRPLDPALWEVADCLSHDPEEDLPAELARLVGENPLIGEVLAGHVRRAQGDLDGALAAYQRAAHARPDEGGPHYLLGETLQALGRPDPAEAEYREAARIDPLESLPLLVLGRMQRDQGKQGAALATLRAAAEATPGWGRAQTELGNALLALSDSRGATEHYSLAMMVDGDLREGLIYDLSAHLAEAELDVPGPTYVHNDYFALDGSEQRVLFMHPPSDARFSLEVPAAAVLAFDAATAPESWSQPGDGVTFVVSVESSQGRTTLASLYIDPENREEDRRWHPFWLSLSPYAGQTITLVLETDPGPAGDDRYDWAGWGTPQLVRSLGDDLTSTPKDSTLTP
jgi:tetratricopeptide (TPR) repeat protein/O-antigen ligase